MRWVLMLALLPACGVCSAQSGQFAALSIDKAKGTAYGWAVGHGSQASASERALQECRKFSGAQCSVVLTFSGGCGAYAVDGGSATAYGWGTAATRSEAESRAKQEARKRGAGNPVTRVWGCNAGKLQVSKQVAFCVAYTPGPYYLTSVFDADKAFTVRREFKAYMQDKYGLPDRYVECRVGDTEADLEPAREKLKKELGPGREFVYTGWSGD